ncbi:MAG TPA: sulfite exporter TauE/SafE family protein, partial [Flavobacteriales bacterium]|nr:sulfite exporter TauE/SafE family protein [Flavobacteriales bacterium]
DGAPSDVPANGGGLALRGLLTGVATSLVGAGGGFLIVPALMAFARLPMKKAVGTSLTIIALNGLIGAASDPHMAQHPDWTLILVVAGIAIAGILVGSVLGHRVPNERLKPAFGWTLLIVGTSILLRELWGLTHGAT